VKNATIPAIAFIMLAVSVSESAEPAKRTQEGFLKAKPQVVEAWQDLRFGMFLCWGPVSLTGREIGWSRGAPAWGRRPGVRGGRGSTPAETYDNLHKQWKPDKFDAEQWVKVAREAGQKYLIFLVKHHDGFCLYDTKLTDYKSTGPESAWKVDVMKHVADACHKHDLKLMLYYSQPDWHHPDYLGEHHDRYIEYLHGQIRELLTNYGEIDGLWFDNLRGRGDNPQAAKLWEAEKLFEMARSIQPHLIINDRCALDGDYSTPEQHVGQFSTDRPWESCITLGTQWSWKPDDQLKSFTEAIRMLVVCAMGNGNLALNTNPMPDGRIEPRQVESFRRIGEWLNKYGESIYGTRGGPFRAPNMDTRKFGSARDRFNLPQGRWWGGSTHKANVVYLHILRWPADTITLPPIKHEILEHVVITGGKATIKQTRDAIKLSVALDHRDSLDTIIKLVLEGPVSDIQAEKSISSSSSVLREKTSTSLNSLNGHSYE
jgi:alpha-L-fucosidase